MLLVTFEPATSPGQLAIFRGKYGIGTNVAIYGPYTGKLANNDDKVELYRPDPPNTNSAPFDVPYVLADRVHYYDIPPWPFGALGADGSGKALQRVSLTGFGNDPTNWFAAVPNFGGVIDSDGDGMPNSWETQYGFNPNNPADANLDPDGDGATNLQEYQAGTHPLVAGSALRLTIENLGANTARLSFLAVSNHLYTIDFKNGLVDPVWSDLVSVSATPTNHFFTTNTFVSTNRFFRLRIP